MTHPTAKASTTSRTKLWVVFSICTGWALALALALTLTAVPSTAQAQTTCNPATASCIPGSGGGGGGSSACTPLNQSIGLCTPGGGSSGGGSGGGVGGPTCQAPPGGNPSCGGGPAVVSGTGPSSGAGNPINLLSGNKYQEETDLAALPGVLGLELKRYYNSQSSHPGLIGANWRMSYETVLYDFGGEIQILQADGRRLMFQRGVGHNAALCSSPQPQDGQVRIEAAEDGRGPPTYHWRWADGRTLSFSGGSGGGFPLQAITAATGERLTLNYSPSGELTGVRDPQGRKLVFIYASAAEAAAQKRGRALKAIDTPLGRLTYSQDSLGRLTEVGQAKDATSAPFVTRLYHYEDRYNAGHKAGLTGISIRGLDPQTQQQVEQRLSTYAYNAAGQAILSTKGRPKEIKDGKPVPDTGIEQIEVQYLDKPLPYDVRIDRQSGEAAPSHLGKVLLTNSLGQQTRVTNAVIGGHFRLIEMRGPGCSTCGPADMRYAYDKAGLLLRSTQLDREGKPIRNQFTELDKYGRTARVGVQTYADNKTQPVQWTLRYEYADVTYQDGSIAVAPQPSLVSRPSVIAGKEHTLAIRYNAAGQITQVTEAGFSPVDEAGQPSIAGTPLIRSTSYRYRTIQGKSVLAEIDGPLTNGPLNSPVDSDVVRMDWNSDGARLVQVNRPGGLTWTIGYSTTNEDGRPIELIERWGSQVLRRRLGFNPSGTINTLRTEALDGQGRVLASREEHRSFDATSQSLSIARDDGAQALVQLGQMGQTSAGDLKNQLPGLLTEHGPPGSVAAEEVLDLRAGTRGAERRLDDFGRLVAVSVLGQRLQTAVYDEADRLRIQYRGDGSIRRLSYNLAGQMTELSDRSAPKFGQPSDEIRRFVWDGAWRTQEDVLDSMKQLLNKTSYSFDAWGRTLSQKLRVTAAGTKPVASFTTSYDEHSRIQSRRFSDGQEVHYNYQTPNVELQQESVPVWLRDALRWIPANWWPKNTLTVLTLVVPSAQSPRIPDHNASKRVSSEASYAESGLAEAWAADATDHRGRVHSHTHNGHELKLDWSASGQLTDVRNEAGQIIAHYDYDARGRRVSKQTSEGTEYAIYDGTQLVSVIRVGFSAQTTTRHYLYSGYRPIVMLDQTSAYRLDTDERGAVVAVYAAGPSLEPARWQANLNPWGVLLSTTGSKTLDPHLRLINQRADDETGLYYNLSRYYDPDKGRYLSPDPRGIADSIDQETPQSLLLDDTVYAAG